MGLPCMLLWSLTKSMFGSAFLSNEKQRKCVACKRRREKRRGYCIQMGDQRVRSAKEKSEKKERCRFMSRYLVCTSVAFGVCLEGRAVHKDCRRPTSEREGK